MDWAFMTANFVARELNYKDSSDWMTCHKATVEAFHGPQFAAKFEELVAHIRGIGFDAIELWVAHLDPRRTTPEMIAAARQILDRNSMRITAYTAGFGTPGVSRAEAMRIFATAQAIGAPVLAQGFHPANGPLVRELAEQYGIQMGLENHPEKTPREVIDKIEPFAPWVGAAVDTGWFATQGYDAVRAVRQLQPYLVDVHLKDIAQPRGHDTCALGDGVVDIKGILAALHEMGYSRPITIEHEPHDRDPTEECRESLSRCRKWWAELERH